MAGEEWWNNRSCRACHTGGTDRDLGDDMQMTPMTQRASAMSHEVVRGTVYRVNENWRTTNGHEQDPIQK